jgi:hypothetical protein
MRSSKEYLQIAQKNAFLHRIFGFDFKDIASITDEDRLNRDLILREFQAEKAAEDMPDRGLNFLRNLHYMGETLKYDLMIKLPDQHRGILNQSIIGMLPIGLVNGCVLQFDDNYQKLDNYVILLNYGLVVACGLLSDALTVEILEDDLMAYRGDGRSYFQKAIQFYCEPSLTGYRKTRTSHSWPAEIAAQIAAKSGSLQAIMLQFIVLHEFGHIVHGDVNTANGITMFNPSDNRVEYLRPIIDPSQNWQIEYDADTYAIATLCNWSSGSPTAWPNFAQAYLFLSWLAEIERLIGKNLCPYHPPASERKAAIYRHALMLASVGPQEDYVNYIDERIKAWSSKLE